MSYRLTRATWNGGLHPGYCIHCGTKCVHASGGGLICPDCASLIRRYEDDGVKISTTEDPDGVAIRPGGIYKILGSKRIVAAIRHISGDDFVRIYVNHDADATSWHENPV